jgi:CxxC motif-containing protein (DUF1111 family)
MTFAKIPYHKFARFYLSCVLAAGVCLAQKDPGPRGGQAAAGGAYSSLNSNEQLIFRQALSVFQEVDSVTGAMPGESGLGLGPTFNGNGCAMCHSQPAVGGSSPGLMSPQASTPNPQVALATLHGAKNTVPSFITIDGPVREARFVSGPNGPDGGVHGLFTIAGRADATGCNLAQPDFATQLANHNVIFRIPTPTFGLGLVENTPDSALRANLASSQTQKAALGIAGLLNTSGNDGTVTRFGWKAQNKSLLIFSGEAYNVEIGVTNEAFPNERAEAAGCMYNATPEDATNIGTRLTSVGSVTKTSSDIVNFSIFMRLSAPPAASTSSSSELNGSAQFASVGCALCHTASLTAAASPFQGMSSATYHPFSDFAVHHMGSNLSDGITQGAAGPDQFRTAPLWGIGQRLFFLHDGRTSDLMEAIEAHTSPGSEANAVIAKFTALSASQKQDILNFLRSL